VVNKLELSTQITDAGAGLSLHALQLALYIELILIKHVIRDLKKNKVVKMIEVKVTGPKSLEIDCFKSSS